MITASIVNPQGQETHHCDADVLSMSGHSAVEVPHPPAGQPGSRQQRRMTARRPLWISWLICGVWIAMCLLSAVVAMRYEFVPGRLGPRRIMWPSDTALPRNAGMPTIVAFLHPRCVCSRATVTHVLQAIKMAPGADVIVSVFVPLVTTDPQAWERGEYVKTIRAAAPRVHIFTDRGGIEAQRFGALTSGTMLVYDGFGRETFRGGITDRRGGEQANPGLQRFVQTLKGEAPNLTESPTPVFGCPLVVTSEQKK